MTLVMIMGYIIKICHIKNLSRIECHHIVN